MDQKPSTDKKGVRNRLARALSQLMCTFHRLHHTWWAVPNFLGEKACSSVTNKGAGIVVAVGRAARRIFIVLVSGCGPTAVVDMPPALKFLVFLNRTLPLLARQWLMIKRMAAGHGAREGRGGSQPAGADTLADLSA